MWVWALFAGRVLVHALGFLRPCLWGWPLLWLRHGTWLGCGAFSWLGSRLRLRSGPKRGLVLGLDWAHLRGDRSGLRLGGAYLRLGRPELGLRRAHRWLCGPDLRLHRFDLWLSGSDFWPAWVDLAWLCLRLAWP